MAEPVPATVDAEMPEIIAVPMAPILLLIVATTRTKVGAGV